MSLLNKLSPEQTFSVKARAGRNRTLTVDASKSADLRKNLLTPDMVDARIENKIIVGDCFNVFRKFPKSIVDLLILDPPYNMNKKFGANSFTRVPVDEYTAWLRNLFKLIKPALKRNLTIYICGDWLSSTSIFTAASEFFQVRNRVT